MLLVLLHVKNQPDWALMNVVQIVLMQHGNVFQILKSKLEEVIVQQNLVFAVQLHH